MKSFTDLFIKRPVLAVVVNLLILIAGVQAVHSINIRQYPRCENAAITVTTVYVGASAELVRGFVTQPLERVIASADGIDYVESKSQLGLSTITARLKLNYDANKALAEIDSKVAQVRNDLPPEAEVPVINITPADSQFASAYLSFSSDILDANQISDYLVRIVQPRLSALEGVQKADILGGRTFAMRVWLKPDRLAALNISPAQVSQVLAANNYLSAVGHTKGSQVQINLTANTDLRSVEEFKDLVIRRSGDFCSSCACATWPTSNSARKTTRPRCASPARKPCSWASGCCPTPTRWTSSSACAPRWIPSRKTCPPA